MSLILKSVRKSYAEKQIINNFSYEFNDTGIYIIKGKSGIGKTTLLRLIASLDNEYEGEIIGGGTNNVSFMFQEHRLFENISALKNVLLATGGSDDETVAKATAILHKLNLTDDDLRKNAANLSGGMKQRISFARALMKNAPILLLDEPTKELDDDSVKAITQLINDEGAKRLVLVVTHDELDYHLHLSGEITL